MNCNEHVTRRQDDRKHLPHEERDDGAESHPRRAPAAAAASGQSVRLEQRRLPPHVHRVAGLGRPGTGLPLRVQRRLPSGARSHVVFARRRVSDVLAAEVDQGPRVAARVAGLRRRHQSHRVAHGPLRRTRL